MNLRKDPIINVIDNGFKRDITVLLEHKCYRGALILIYSTIDAITFSSSPKNKTDRYDFINWCDTYLKIIGIDERKEAYKLSGIDLYGARCSIVHTYGHMLESDLSKQGKCCIIGYMDGSVKQNPASVKTSWNSGQGNLFVMVSVIDLSDALFKGINDFLIDLYNNKEKNKDRIYVFENKVKQYIHELNICDL